MIFVRWLNTIVILLTKLLSNSLFPSVFYTVMYVLTSVVFVPVLIKMVTCADSFLQPIHIEI